MAEIYELNGQIIRVITTSAEEGVFTIPEVYDHLLSFDSDTNSALLERLNTDWQGHSMPDGVLHYLSQPVTINPPGEYYQDYEYLRTWWQQLNTALDNTDTALLQTEQAESLWPTLTAKQKQDWLVDHFDEVLGGLALVLRVLHGILRFIRWLIKREAIV